MTEWLSLRSGCQLSGLYEEGEVKHINVQSILPSFVFGDGCFWSYKSPKNYQAIRLFFFGGGGIKMERKWCTNSIMHCGR